MHRPLISRVGAALAFLVALNFFAVASSAQSAQMTDGGEFEFVDPTIPVVIGRGLKGHEEKLAARFVEVLSKDCKPPSCRETLVDGKWSSEHRFEFKEGFAIQVSWDPNVVEILTEADSRLNRHRLKDRLQEVIFGTAEKAGLRPDPSRRAGHYNAGAISTFGDDGAKFLRFFIDFANRPELALGLLRDPNFLNAPPLSAQSKEQREALAALAAEVWQEVRCGRTPTIADVAQKIIDRVYVRTFDERYQGSAAVHYQAFGLKKLPRARRWRDQPFELRSVRSQSSFEEFLLIGDLVEARVAYTNSLPPDVAFHVTGIERTSFEAQELVDRFYVYVVETGLSWNKFRRLLPPSLQNVAVSGFLMTGLLQSEKDLHALRGFMDLIPSSPWLERKISEILTLNRVPTELRRDFENLFGPGFGSAPRCSAIFASGL